MYSVTIDLLPYPSQESGAKLTDISPRGVHAVFETLRSVLHSGQVTSRVQYMIEVMFAVRKDKFQVRRDSLLTALKLQCGCSSSFLPFHLLCHHHT